MSPARVMLIASSDAEVAPRNAPTITMLKDTGRLSRVSPSVMMTEVSTVARMIETVAVEARDPTRLLAILEPSSRTPRSNPITEIRTAARKERVPDPLRLPIRKELLFQPKRKVRANARTRSRLSITFGYQHEYDVARVLGVIRYVICHEDKVAEQDDRDRVHLLAGCEQPLH